ncbi:Lrp/AsnC family transcriptional regulator [Candidatus Woesearchaeota archaeon]|nr:Lrp/AsnC family transcriptional regulator [Candidatus Woesearchaeota archaeon]
MSEIIKLDKLDKKILLHLDRNSRIFSSKLGKRLKISREVVDYRINRLMQKGVIKKFYTHIAIHKISYTLYKLYLKIKGLDPEQEKGLIEYFNKNENVIWVASCDGVYDLIVTLAHTDVYKLNDILQDCFHRYGSYFISKDITISTRTYNCLNSFLGWKAGIDEPFLIGKEKGFQTLDEKNMELLRLLANNARMPVVELAKKLELTSSAVIYRMRELEKKGFIGRYSCLLDGSKLGYVFCKVFLTLNFVNKEKEKELFQFCLQHNNITLFVYCIGQWDFEINIKIDSMPAFHELLKEIKARFSEIIKECESVIIFKEHKFNRFPGAYPTGS